MKEIEEFFEVAGFAEGFAKKTKEVVNFIVNLQERDSHEKELLNKVTLDFLENYCSFEKVKPELINLYCWKFTKEEIVEITNFYKSEVGKKFMSTSVDLEQQCGLILNNIIQKNLAHYLASIDGVTGDDNKKVFVENRSGLKN